MSATVITFYSYKGGVGRSFALANVATILAQWGFKVLVVDWDIEAPGLENYFSRFSSKSCPGVIDFLEDCVADTPQSSSAYQIKLQLPEALGELTLMPAANIEKQKDYTAAVQRLNWDQLFAKHRFGERLENMRTEWLSAFDFIFVDSRTGVTDFSGITTVLLPDVLIFQFTANNQSLQGSCDVVRRAKEARQQLPLDRPALLTMPIPSRFEQREEYDRAQFWRQEFARQLSPFFADWVPESIEATRMVDVLSIPHVPRWTFGEELAVLEEPAGSSGIRSSNFPATYALETISSIIANRFDRIDLLYSSRDEYVLTALESGRSAAQGSENRPHKVFVSYRHEDRMAVMAIMKELSRFEITFSSMEGIEPGQSWSKELENAVQMADTFILVIGREFSRQQFVEAQIFLRSSLRSQENRERRIIPLMLSDATPTLPGF